MVFCAPAPLALGQHLCFSHRALLPCFHCSCTLGIFPGLSLSPATLTGQPLPSLHPLCRHRAAREGVEGGSSPCVRPSWFDTGRVPGTHESCSLTIPRHSWAEDRKI